MAHQQIGIDAPKLSDNFHAPDFQRPLSQSAQ